MKLIHLFENYLSLDTVKEFNKQIRRHPLEEGFKRMSFRMVMSRNNPFFIRS